MALDSKAMTKIARLAHIEISDAENEHFAKEISGILNWVEQLGEVNTDNVPQMTSVAQMSLPRRADEVTDGNQQEAVVANAASSDHGCFVVPKVIE